MENLSITQKYFICAVNEKGGISSFNTKKMTCFVISGLLDLSLAGCIRMDKKTAAVLTELPVSLAYLTPLYDFIAKGESVKLNKIMERYTCSMTDKELHILISSVGDILEVRGLAVSAKSGILGNRKNYIPADGICGQLIDALKFQLLKEETIAEEVAALIILLEKSGMAKQYFTKEEHSGMKERISVILKSPAGVQVKKMVDYVEGMAAAAIAAVPGIV